MPQPHQHPPHQTTPQPHQHPPHQATQQPHQHPPHQATAQLNQHPLHQATPQSHQHLSHQGTPQSHQHPSHQTTPQPHQHPSHQVTSQPLQHMSQTPQPQHPPHQATPQPHQHPPQQTIQPPHQHSPHQATQPTHQHTPSQVTTQPQPSQQPPQSQPQMQFEFIRELPHPPQIRSRISLLPPNSDYMTGLARSRLQQAEMYRENVATSMGASSGSSMQNDVMPPFKKIRLGEMKAEVQKPLRIDTRDQPAYNPEVENISPTIPPDPIVPEDAAFRTTKDELLQQISKVDREILKAETQISNLKKKRQELEKAANKPACIEEEEEVAQPKHQSLAQKIYAVNRPLYNQPSDTPVYHENKIRHVERENREKNMTATYSKMMQEWLRKVEKIESSLKRKLKESRNREFFEKVFPELRKQREDRERFNRVGARIKSEADLEEIMDSLQEQEREWMNWEKNLQVEVLQLPPLKVLDELVELRLFLKMMSCYFPTHMALAGPEDHFH
uniref:N-CoR GPS2-interacting domain-containing protein n=1 Tax=Timema douglasi TaxID=61478 RepID=A0A7R8VS03_TIMDO|nr:unnamed protein product [Timema douglasi]